MSFAVIMLLGSMTGGAAIAADRSPSIQDLKELNIEDLMNIEVTSVTRGPERLLSAASAIQVITAADIRRSGATTLPEALRLAGNLQVAQRSAHGWAVSARGFNADLANKLLVLIDGRTVYTPLFSGVYWEAQDYLLEDIDRIEVISGPGGTLWGANAVNGVINIITKGAADTAGLHAEAGAGSTTDRFVAARYGGMLAPDVHFRAYGKHFSQDDFALGDGASANDGWRKTQGGFRIDSTGSAATTRTLQGDIYKLRVRAPTGGTSTMQGANLLGRLTHRISDDSDWALKFYYDWSRLMNSVPALVIDGTTHAPAGILRDNLHTLDLDFQHRLPLGSMHRVVWGFGVRRTLDRADSAPALAFAPERLNQTLYSVFAQDELQLQEDLSITVGTKLEHNDYTGLEVEPSVRLQWLLDSSTTVWAAVSRAVRTPSRIDRDFRQAEPPLLPFFYGSPEFRSEDVIAYELGYRAQPAAAVNASLSAYYNVYDDVRSINITPDTIIPFVIANDVAGHSYGLEAAGSVQVTDNWTLHAAWNYLETRLHVKEGAFDLSNALNEVADPGHQVSLRSSINLPGGWELDGALRWVGTLHNNNGPTPGTVPDYLDLNLRLGWQVNEQLELSVAGQNLLQKQHPEYGFPGPTRAEVERSVFGKLVWRH